MILNYVELENIRSYEKERIDFPRGITLFEGDIGSGKSTVLMGIEFALFGLGSQKPESLLSKKASEGSVILEFEVDEKRYLVKRKLRRKGDSVSQDAKESYLIYDGQTEPLSPSELKQRILQILKFNEPSDPRSESRIFRYAVFTPQEEMKQILRDAGKRLETIRKAFGVEDYRIITDNAKSMSGKIKESMVEFAVRFERVDEDEKNAAKSRESANQLETAIAKLEQEKRSLDEKKSKIVKELDTLNERIKQKERLQIQQDKINEQIKSKISTISIFESQSTSAQKEIAQIDSSMLDLGKIVQPTMRTINEIDLQISELSDLRDRIMNGKSNLRSLEFDLARLQKDLGEFVHLSKSEPDMIRKDLEEIRAKIESGVREKSELERQRITLEKEDKDIKNLIAELQNLGAKCPHCEHDLTPEHKKRVEAERSERLQGVQANLSQIDAEILEVTQKVDDLKKEELQKDQKLRHIERTAPLRDQWFEKNSLVDALRKDVPELESQFAVKEEESFQMMPGEDALSYLRRLKDAQKEYMHSKQKASELELQKQKLMLAIKDAQFSIDEQKSSITQLRKELELISGHLEEFSELEQTAMEKSREQSELERNLDDIRSLLIKNAQILEGERARTLELEDRIAEAKQWQAKHHKFSNYYLWMREFFIPTIDKIEKQVLLSIQQDFNEVYRKWYSVLIEDVTKESKIDENFTPLVEQDGFLQDVEFLSGGEKTSIALAYRLALNSMMRQESEGLKSNLLILDEPTDGFSKTQLSKVRNLLYELKSQQIILVSHEKELETYVDNIFHITKDSGVSRVLRLGT